MIEVRKDYILDQWVIISEGRGSRPIQFKKVHQKIDGECFFCPGKESLTPPEIARFPAKGDWQIRVFPNKFPAVAQEKGKTETKGLFRHQPAYGFHEVIVETPNHEDIFSDLSEQRIVDSLKMYAQRVSELSKKKGITYVLLFKNEGREAGTSLIHTHSQVVAYSRVPQRIVDEAKKSTKGKKCLYCDIIKKEAKSPRKVLETKHVVAFCPYASRFNYESWIF